jgi:galactofuranosylgalactofuranosylrhamnosyl-N-acetylglucosaminyl-diphospho-decaprenol beta-1,5/1,6-galactofuranosyltransferase
VRRLRARPEIDGRAVLGKPPERGAPIAHAALGPPVELGRRGAAVLWRLYREGPQAAAEWRRRLPEISSRETWTRLFGTR